MADTTVLQEHLLRLSSLAVFRGVLEDPVVAAFRALCDSDDLPVHQRVDRCAAFAALLLDRGGSWTDYLLGRVLRDENAYVRRLAAGEDIPRLLEIAVERELEALTAVASLTAGQVAETIDTGVPLPKWEVWPRDFASAYRAHMVDIGLHGYGVFADHHMFLLEQGELVPVRHPDPVDYDSLTGYEDERDRVERNTLALVEGRPAANALLYGDSGTGKSTCVKAVANRYRHRGLRLIELRKSQLDQIPWIIDRLSGNPLKFILFIDDLSFTGGDGDFSSLKAILEGGISARTANIVIYATSNRRHLVQERFSQRDGDDVHVRDTLEELSSLSERFGLTVTFLRPDRDLYLSIVQKYCDGFFIPWDDEVRRQAESFALHRGGRSPRTARQFAESLASYNPQGHRPATEESI